MCYGVVAVEQASSERVVAAGQRSSAGGSSIRSCKIIGGYTEGAADPELEGPAVAEMHSDGFKSTDSAR